jgi:hypothetical protein
MVPPEKVIAVHRALEAAAIPHAVGGAIALGLYGAPRETLDIDVNVFVSVDESARVAAGLRPLGVDVDFKANEFAGADLDAAGLGPDQDARLPWGENPVHLFFSFDELHAAMPAAVREVPFGGTTIPIVAPEHLVVRKAMLDRPKDWSDIEAILVADEPLDLAEVEHWLACLAGPDDPRLTKLRRTLSRIRR